LVAVVEVVVLLTALILAQVAMVATELIFLLAQQLLAVLVQQELEQMVLAAAVLE
jgi:hypothetical protein